MHAYIETISDNPVIAAVQNKKALERALALHMPTVFLLWCRYILGQGVGRHGARGRMQCIFAYGPDRRLASTAKALDYVKKRVSPCGIISTKSTLIKYARESGLFCIQRFFMVDSASYQSALQTVGKTRPSMVELMPGHHTRCHPPLYSGTAVPVIAGGLVTERREVIDVLAAGALGVSTGRESLWTENS